MTKKNQTPPLTSDLLLNILEALANSHRLTILSLLTQRRIHVSQLARELNISRPLVFLHLKRLKRAGLIKGTMEISEDGKAMHFYELAPLSLQLSPEIIADILKKHPFKEKKNDANLSDD